MKHRLKICLVLILFLAFSAVWATPISKENVNAIIGNFTGPIGGTAQDDNVKASLDLLHDRLSAAVGTGTIFYVDSGVAGSGGLTQATAVATIQAGVDLCTPSSGDIVYILPGHAENIATAAALDFDCAGITVIALGNGEDQPTVSMITNATATVAITDPSVFIYNLKFLGNYTNGITECLDISGDGDGFGIVNCQFRETTNDKELLIMITISAAADEGLIQGCKFIGISGGDSSSAISMEGASDQTIIEDNYFYGDWSDYVIKNGAASISMVIKDNIINNLDTGAGKLMSFHTNSYGSLINNKCYGNGATFALVADKMFVSPDNVFMATENVELRNYETMFGEFTGAATGLQGTSVYADMVLAQTDLDAILALTALSDANTSLVGMLGYDDADNVYSSDDVVANADGSILERLEQVDTDTSAILIDTAVIGALGAGLSAVPYNAAWDAEIESEGTDAIEADDLDHLVKVAESSNVANSSVVAKLAAKGATPTWSTFNNQTDSLEAIRDSIDGLTGFGYRGTADTGSSVTSIITDLTGYGDDYFNTDWSLIVIKDVAGLAAAPEGVQVDITDYVSTTGTFTVLTTGTACADGDEVMVVRTDELNLDDVTVLGGSGDIWYVDSGAATGDSTGKTWENACITLLEAIALATASNGDVINFAAGHSEALVATTAVNKAGLTFIGRGEGSLMSKIQFNDTDAQLTVTVADITFENMHFEAVATDVVTGIALNATSDGFTLRNCRFTDETVTTDEFLIYMTLALNCDDVTIEGCEFISVGSAATEGIFLGEVVDNFKFVDNYMKGTWTVSAIWTDAILTNALFKDNVLHNDKTGQHCLEVDTAAALGLCVGNKMYGDTLGSIFDPGSMNCFENYAIDGIDESAVLVPVTTIAGQSYSTSVTNIAFATPEDHLFDIDGGDIWIDSFVGIVTELVDSNVMTITINIDRDDTAADTAISTAVACETDVPGTMYVFSTAQPAVLTPLTPGAVGIGTPAIQWYCPEGMIEQANMPANLDGTIVWTMKWRPCADGTTVTAQ